MKSGTARHSSLAVHPSKAWPPEITATSADDLGCFDANSTYTERSAVSLFLGGGATVFVGFIQSTMSFGLVKLRAAKGKLSS
eukprot:scaffold18736_cov33-Prasinocladus_malaysianus.AAC.1